MITLPFRGTSRYKGIMRQESQGHAMYAAEIGLRKERKNITRHKNNTLADKQISKKAERCLHKCLTSVLEISNELGEA